MALALDRSMQPATNRPDPDRLTATGLILGAYLAMFLCQFDLCMLRQERIRFAPAYPLIGSLAAMGVALWYLVPGQITRILKGTTGPIISFGLIAICALAGAALPEANFNEGWKYILYPSMDFLVFATSIPLAAIFVSRPNWQAACAFAMLALVGSIMVDARYPGTFSFLDARAAGFGVNPNSGAALCVMLLIGLLDWNRPRLSPLTCGWFLLALIGVFMTLSRSGTLSLGVVGMIYMRLCVRRNSLGTLVILGGLIFSVGGYALMAADAAKQVLPLFEASGSRANLFSGQFDAMETSEDSRVLLALEHFEMGMERPFLGWGTGRSYLDEDGAHNMFLARWVENGIPGLLAYIFLIGTLFHLGYRHHSWECMALAIFVATQSFFTHNLLEDKALLIMMAITAGRTALSAANSAVLQSAVLRTRSISYPSPVSKARVG